MIYAIVTIAVLILDQAVKFWTSTKLVVGETRTLIPGFIEILYTQNKGAAFGFLKNVEFARWLFVALVIIFSIAVIYILSKNIVKGSLGRWMLVLIMAGGLGNCIDRVIHGYVVDMFNFMFVDFAIFNVADMFLTVCGIILCFWIIFHKPEKPEAPPAGRRTRRRPAAEGSSQPPANNDYIEQIKKPVVQARATLAQQRAVAAESAQQKGRPTARPQAPANTSDPFAEFFGGVKSAPVPPQRAKTVSEPVAFSPEPAKKASASKKSDTDFSLDDILAEFSGK